MIKRFLIFVVVLVSFASVCNAQLIAQLPENRLLNKPMPEVTGSTLTGKKIDKAYFKGKVTFVNFMFIGCFACMKEINALNQLHDSNKGNTTFQILGISANTAEQLLHFNSVDTSTYSRIRMALKTEPIAYDLMAECAIQSIKQANTLGRECTTISERFLFNAHPTSFLIDKKGTIRKVITGFTLSKDDGFVFDESGKLVTMGTGKGNKEFLKELQTEIDRLMAE
jgi:peroxiredoxin